MKALFTWLDGHSWSYGVMAGGSILLALAWAWRGGREDAKPAGAERGGDRAVTGAWFFLALLAGRWPALLEVHSVGVREAQLLSGAFAMAHDLMPYRAVDLGAEGWLAAWALVPTHWAGLPADYFVARLIGLLMDWGTLVLIHGMLRRFLPRAVALLGMLPLAVALGTPHVPAWYQYSGWHAALLLTVLSARLLWPKTEAAGRGSLFGRRWIVAGFCLALIPWTSRGAVLLAAGLWSAMAISNWRASTGNRPAVFKAGGLALYCTAAMLCFLHGIGQWERFWAGYVSGQALGDIAAPWGPGSWGWMMVALPAVAFVCCASRWPQSRVRLSLGFLAVIAGVSHLAMGVPEIFGHFAEYWRRPYSDLGGRIRSMHHPGDRLAVWGLRPQLYIESGLTQAVGSGATAGEILDSNPWRDNFRRRFFEEMRERKPFFFVDTGADGLGGYAARSRSGHEAFPELGDYVRDYYQLVSDDGTARLYLRSRRAQSNLDSATQSKFLDLSDLKVLQSTGPVTVIDETRWLAHAPSRLTCVKPAGAAALYGIYGFVEGAYAKSEAGTDGATFVIEAVARNGRRDRLLERRLNPVSNPDDRGQISFKVELPPGDGWEIHFVIESGNGMAFDWTYWGALQFE